MAARIEQIAGWITGAVRAGRAEAISLVALALFAGSLWAYIEIADSVHEGDTRYWDEKLMLSLRQPGRVDDPLGAAWVEELARDLTAFGSLGVLSIITLTSVLFLLLRRKRRTAVLVASAVISGILVSYALKLGADRPRPDLVPHLTRVMSTSFPSGHAMVSAVTYLTLGSLLARAHARYREKAYFLGVAVFMTLMVGFSRVYLGVHWPSDVLAGWTAGANWALVWWLIARRLQERGDVEGEARLG
jgi:undecaprenyl-diphosphatase